MHSDCCVGQTVTCRPKCEKGEQESSAAGSQTPAEEPVAPTGAQKGKLPAPGGFNCPPTHPRAGDQSKQPSSYTNNSLAPQEPPNKPPTYPDSHNELFAAAAAADAIQSQSQSIPCHVMYRVSLVAALGRQLYLNPIRFMSSGTSKSMDLV